MDLLRSGRRAVASASKKMASAWRLAVGASVRSASDDPLGAFRLPRGLEVPRHKPSRMSDQAIGSREVRLFGGMANKKSD